ncbi:uncharacterized protein LOC119769341 [Culex quinquefasciatus]|uniref:uncharacterized protein LOC119769341 n=1 Tax=Culex quinquefasciatus TaxID=7176 RepID=UPI0018E3D593|nr:uncharacterized protein LOC119769341 [Culex quinquefasciatus]
MDVSELSQCGLRTVHSSEAYLRSASSQYATTPYHLRSKGRTSFSSTGGGREASALPVKLCIISPFKKLTEFFFASRSRPRPSGPSKPDPAKSRKSSCLVQMRYDRIFDGEPRRSVQSVLEVRAAVVSESDQFARRSQRRTYATEASKSTVYQQSTQEVRVPNHISSKQSVDVRGTSAEATDGGLRKPGKSFYVVIIKVKKHPLISQIARHEMRGPARVTNHGTTPPQAAQDLSRERSATVRLEQSNPSKYTAAVQPVPKWLHVAARERQEEQLKKKTTTAPNLNNSAYSRLRSSRFSSMISSPSIAVNSRRRSMYEH